MDEQQMFEMFGKTYQAGTVLFEEGDEGTEMFVIHSGEIEISRRIKDRDTVVAVLGPGEFFGEMAIVNNRPRSATATVRTTGRLLHIDGRTFEAMLRGKVEIAVRMIKTLARRLERANQQIELLLLRDANHRVVQALRQLAGDGSVGSPDAEGHEEGTGAAVFIPVALPDLAARVALPESEVAEVLAKLADARLVVTAQDAEIEGEGYVIPEVGRLLEFLEFLEMKERFKEA